MWKRDIIHCYKDKSLLRPLRVSLRFSKKFCRLHNRLVQRTEGRKAARSSYFSLPINRINYRALRALSRSNKFLFCLRRSYSEAKSNSQTVLKNSTLLSSEQTPEIIKRFFQQSINRYVEKRQDKQLLRKLGEVCEKLNLDQRHLTVKLSDELSIDLFRLSRLANEEVFSKLLLNKSYGTDEKRNSKGCCEK
ncbi:MAG: hypothetical protein MHMPM18_001013 [Marteilia pararefringens]